MQRHPYELRRGDTVITKDDRRWTVIACDHTTFVARLLDRGTSVTTGNRDQLRWSDGEAAWRYG